MQRGMDVGLPRAAFYDLTHRVTNRSSNCPNVLFPPRVGLERPSSDRFDQQAERSHRQAIGERDRRDDRGSAVRLAAAQDRLFSEERTTHGQWRRFESRRGSAGSTALRVGLLRRDSEAAG